MYVTTTNDLPGFRVTRHIGLVRGVTVRSRNAISDAIGGVQSMLGGRVAPMSNWPKPGVRKPMMNWSNTPRRMAPTLSWPSVTTPPRSCPA